MNSHFKHNSPGFARGLTVSWTHGIFGLFADVLFTGG